MGDRWHEVAQRLEAPATGPTVEQLSVAKALDVDLPVGIPAPVASVVLRVHLAGALRETIRPDAEVPESLEL